MQSTVLNVFPSQSTDQRLVLVQEWTDQGKRQLVLRQESRSEHVGWFVQSRIVIEPDQVSALKMTLTSNLIGEPVAGESHAGESRAGNDDEREDGAEILSFVSAMAG